MKLRQTVICLIMLDQNDGTLERLVQLAASVYSRKVELCLEFGIRIPPRLNELVTRMNESVLAAAQGLLSCTGYLFTFNPTPEGFAEMLKQFTKNYINAFDIYEEISNFIIEKPSETD